MPPQILKVESMPSPLFISIQIEGRKFPSIADQRLAQNIMSREESIRMPIENRVLINCKMKNSSRMDLLENRAQEADTAIMDARQVDLLVVAVLDTFSFQSLDLKRFESSVGRKPLVQSVFEPRNVQKDNERPRSFAGGGDRLRLGGKSAVPCAALRQHFGSFRAIVLRETGSSRLETARLSFPKPVRLRQESSATQKGKRAVSIRPGCLGTHELPGI